MFSSIRWYKDIQAHFDISNVISLIRGAHFVYIHQIYCKTSTLYQSKMTDVASVTFSLYQLFFLGLSYHQKVPVTKKREKGSYNIDHFLNHTGITGLLQQTLV